ncbi:RNA polymerase sigma factor SigI [Robertmurraya korlensis]|uniref:RNA polymerase sigma factor SigI n=1 Tax=Robertmurraya korlensis TaxID=519977 RepID=UPI002559FB93|nr:RNA polymerase sigma factor SigI [Robertmurraya korlensis]
MLGLLFLQKKKKRTLEETVFAIQNGDQGLQNELIHQYKPFIAKSVSSVCKRYISETDDEFSIGLIAFNEAIQKYSSDKGSSLLSFAEVIIKRRVIDYIRQQIKHQNLSMDVNGFEETDEEVAQSSLEANMSLEEFYKKTDEELRRQEIIHFSKLLTEFDLSFSDLVENSPKHADARKNAMLVAKEIVSNDEIKQILVEKKRLPIKQIEDSVSVSRKTIERNRKYIIAISIILMNDYLYLQDYVKGVLET